MQSFGLIDSSVKQALVAMSSSRRLPHAFLIESPSPAKAAALSGFISSLFLCDAQPEHRPCGDCAACLKAARATHPDIAVVSGEDRANSIHIDSIRQLKSDAFLKPNDGDSRIIIIENAHNMTISAQNALLKILEEPPPHLVFILTCKNTAGCAQTIVSRCVKLLLSPETAEAAETVHAEAAESFYNAVVAKDIYALLAVLFPFEKNKEELLGFLQAASARVYRAITGAENPNQGDLLQLAAVIDILRDAAALVDANVGAGLVCANIACLISETC